MTKDDMSSLVQVDVSIDGQAWKEVETFENYGPADPVYTLDPTKGIISFGDGTRGCRPPTGSTITATYGTGAGSAGNIMSFTWTASDANLHLALSATIMKSPRSFRVSLYQGTEQSWRWRFVTWLCDAMKESLLDSLPRKK
jgi:hypothetical protein